LIHIFLFIDCDLYSQFKKGKIELSFSGNLGTSSLSRTSTETGSVKTDLNFVQVFISSGYYVTDEILISGDLGYFETQSDKNKEVINEDYLIVNLSYVYKIPKKDIGIFIKTGYGFSNTPFNSKADYIIQSAYKKAASGIFNLSTGLKLLLGKETTISAEINYKNINWDRKTANNLYVEYKNIKICLLLGFSIII
jgi:hypothetical protein